MIRINQKLKKTISSVMTAVMIMTSSSGIIAHAESETATTTYRGVNVTCKLDCDFSLTENDNGTASSSWTGMNDCKVRTQIYCCSNMISSYVLKDTATAAKKAKVSASQSGVWKFKSKHYVVSKDGNRTLSNLTTLTDW